MADLAGDPYGYDFHSRRGWARQAALAAGAAAAIGLAAGLVSWGHGLLTRDAGLVPFLRAEEGPMRMVPEDPGGIKLERTDLAVTNILSGPRAGDPSYAPAPERPETEDLAQPYLKPPAAPGVDGRVAAGAPAGTASAPADAEGADAMREALARASAAASAAESAGTDAGADAGSTRAPSAMPMAPARPRAPAPGTRTAAVAAIPASAAGPAAAAAPAASIETGDVVIQLGAFNTDQIAESQWARQARRNEDLLGAYGHTITTVESGGRTLFRLRVGPMTDRQRAQDLCAALKARGDACIVAKVR